MRNHKKKWMLVEYKPQSYGPHRRVVYAFWTEADKRANWGSFQRHNAYMAQNSTVPHSYYALEPNPEYGLTEKQLKAKRAREKAEREAAEKRRKEQRLKREKTMGYAPRTTSSQIDHTFHQSS